MRLPVRAALAALAAAPLAAPLFASAGLQAQQAADTAAAGSTSLTIYNDGRVLMRRTVPLAVPRGASTQRVPIGELDPGSLFALDPEVAIGGVRLDAAVDEESAFRRSVGRTLGFLVPRAQGGADTLQAEVLAADPVRLRLPGGRIAFRAPGIPLFQADAVTVAPTAVLQLRAASARDRLRLGWFTSGAQWQASYHALLDGKGSARVSGLAVVRSETLRATGAEVQLLAGQVNRAGPQPMYRQRAEMAQARVMEDAAAYGNAAQQQVGDFHVYTLPGRLDVLPGQATSVALFDPGAVPYERRYVASEGFPFWGFIPQERDTSEVGVDVRYTFKRPRESDFGGRPLPGGVLRLFEADSAGRMQLIGEAATGHTPAGEDVAVSTGTAFDLTAKRVQTSYVTRRDSSAARGVRTVATIGYSVVVRNAGTREATVDVREARGGEWTVVRSSIPPRRASSSVVYFPVRVPAGGATTLTYTIRAEW